MKHFMRKGFQSNGHKGNVSEAWQPGPTIPAGFMVMECFHEIFKNRFKLKKYLFAIDRTILNLE